MIVEEKHKFCDWIRILEKTIDAEAIHKLAYTGVDIKKTSLIQPKESNLTKFLKQHETKTPLAP